MISNIETATRSFYGQHQAGITRLFDIVGLPPEAAETLETAVTATQPWVQGDHSRPENRVILAESATPELHDIYDTFGLMKTYELPPGDYDQIVVLGGIHRGNNRRLKFLGQVVTSGKVDAERIMLLGGEREVYLEAEAELIDQNLRDIVSRNIADSWIERVQSGKVLIQWETDLLRLAAMAQLGSLTPKDSEYNGGKLTDRPHLKEFEWQRMPLFIMHTQAVARQGKPRHTTEACMVDWLDTVQPRENAHVAFIGANPHIARMGRSAAAILKTHGRSDIELVLAGPHSVEGLGHSHFLGEIARHLYEDIRLEQS